MKQQIKTAVLGCTGYTGIELIKILIKHPNVIITFLGSQNHKGEYINNFDQLLKNVTLPKLESLDNLKFEEVDVVFLALPQNISQNNQSRFLIFPILLIQLQIHLTPMMYFVWKLNFLIKKLVKLNFN